MDGSLEGVIAVFILILLGIFVAGVAAAIASTVLVIMKKKPILSIILSVISLPLIVIPLFFTVGTISLLFAVPVLAVYCISVVILSVRPMRANANERNTH